MRYLLLSSEDGSRPIIEWPSGSDPQALALRQGAKIFEPCDSLEDAQRLRSNDQTGKWLGIRGAVNPSNPPPQRASRDVIAPMSERIAISPGIFIELKNGRAGSRGREESEVLPTVLFWLHRNPEHENCERVREWVQYKESQVEEDVRERRISAKRYELNA